MLHRRLARDYETLPTRSEAMIHLAMTDLMARRLTGEIAVHHSHAHATPRDADIDHAQLAETTPGVTLKRTRRH